MAALVSCLILARTLKASRASWVTLAGEDRRECTKGLITVGRGFRLICCRSRKEGSDQLLCSQGDENGFGWDFMGLKKGWCNLKHLTVI